MIRKSRIPDGGWNRSSFSRHGASLIQDLVRISRYSRARRQNAAQSSIQGVISKQLEEFASRAEEAGGKSGFGIEVEVTRSFWDALMQQHFNRESGETIGNAMKPHITSMLMQGYARIAPLIDVPVRDEIIRSAVPRMAEEMAREIRSVDSFTRQRVENVVYRSLENGDTVRETARILRERLPSISNNRAAVIARTEIMNAYTRGNVYAYQASGVISHVSVIGCSQGADSPHEYEGRHTCNIKDVPVEDAHKLRFHPNHKGTMVPSKFID